MVKKAGNGIWKSTFLSAYETPGKRAKPSGPMCGCRLRPSLFLLWRLRFSVIGWEPRAVTKAAVRFRRHQSTSNFRRSLNAGSSAIIFSGNEKSGLDETIQRPA